MASNEVSANLDKFINSDLDKLITKGMAKSCSLVRNDAIEKAPQKTGALKRSIDFEVSEDGHEGVIFSNLKYAPYVEVGTGIYATKGNGRDTPWVFPYYSEGETKFAKTEGQKPQPFLEPALTENTQKIRDCFEGLF